MRKADYTALATIVKKYRADMERAFIESDSQAQKLVTSARGSMCTDIARDFARVASVDAQAFLKACGIE